MDRIRRIRRLIVLFALVVVAQPLVAANGADEPTAAAGSSDAGAATDLSQRSIRALRASADGNVFVSNRKSTGVAGFVRVERNGDLLPASTVDASRVKSDDFLARFGEVFGITDTSQLVLTSRFTDALGATHLTYEQVFQGVPVFGAVLKVHLDAENRLTAVNGVFIPGISLGTSPRLSAAEAGRLAIAEVVADPPVDEDGEAAEAGKVALTADSATLMVYRTGLIRNVPGSNQLAYEVVVTNGSSVREFVYVHAHAGKILNRYSGVTDALFRRLFEQTTATQVWQEGDSFPGALTQDQQNIVLASGDSYHFFNNAFGRDSYDAAGAEMRSVNNDPTINCPNANWNGATTNYCNGVTADDVVAHEWGHAYTEYTHNLIYQWQSGALNEAYSDIWGETVDFLNGRGTDAPNATRGAGGCTSHTLERLFVMINSPASIAGFCTAREAMFGPQLGTTGPITGDVVLVNDGVASTSNGCEPFGGVAGKIALIDRGTCAFTVKVKNAQNAGATGVLIADNVWGPPQDPLGGEDATITIPSVRIPLGSGNLFKSTLATDTVNVTMRVGHSSPEDNVRWLEGEDATAFGTPGAHAIRDMWNPRCVQDPGRVTDAEYWCALADGGGVHTNSGVPNHGYALLVDGGAYNGHTIGQIGLVKAAHLYFRAQLTYQTPTTGFPEHADALVAACIDLVGEPLNGLSTTSTPAPPSGEVITLGDCAQVSEVISALELRTDPTEQCNFQPVLQPGEPNACGFSTTSEEIYAEDFEDGLGGWTLSNDGVYPGWEVLGPFDWTQATSLPGGRSGAAAFAVDPQEGNCDFGAGDVSGVQRLESAPILIPEADSAVPRLTFDHYVATEAGWDGGNLKVSINGGPYVVPADGAYTFNSYNVPNLNTAAQGNTNPLAGEDGWTGTDGGSLGGSWGESQLNLASVGAVPGDTIRLRFDFGIDGCTGIDGWYVDDVTVFLCFTTPPTIEVAPGGIANSDTTGTMNLVVDDVESPEDTLVLSGSSSNTGLVPNSGITFAGTGAARTVTITTNARASGTSIVTVTVSDQEGGTASVDITVIVGGNRANTLMGTEDADLFFGRNDADAIFGLGGHDLASGGNGEDTIDAGAGDDGMWGRQGVDTLTGGTGADAFNGGGGVDTATDFNAGEGDTQTGIP